MGATFTQAFSGITWGDPLSLLKFGVLGVLIPSVAVYSVWRLFIRGKSDGERIKRLVVSYDEDDDLDEPSIIGILDLQL